MHTEHQNWGQLRGLDWYGRVNERFSKFVPCGLERQRDMSFAHPNINVPIDNTDTNSENRWYKVQDNCIHFLESFYVIITFIVMYFYKVYRCVERKVLVSLIYYVWCTAKCYCT